MNTTIRNILAVIIGVVGGGIVNLGLITVGSSLIPAPEGVDVMDSQSIADSLHLFGPKNFIFPFFAHALGTLSGAMVAYSIAASHKMRIAYVIGAVFLFGGISMVFMIPAPMWFIVLDLGVAYLPMAWLAIFLLASRSAKNVQE